MKTALCFSILLAFVLSVVVALGSRRAHIANYLLYVGTYTKGESKGIYGYRYAAASGDLKPLGLVASTVNPSFLAIDPAGRVLYAVNEIGDYQGKSSGAVTAFAIDHATGKLSQLNQVASGGADPCYIALDKTGHYALVANYTSGSVAVFPLLKDGQLGEASAFVQHQGKSVNPERQQSPHAHWIETTVDNRFAIAADLGIDELLVYRFDARRGSLAPNDPPFAKVKPGAGPRHVAFHPGGKFAYAVNELNSTVTAFSYDSAQGSLHPLEAISTVPKDAREANDAAEIHVLPNGKFLLVSNRGHDSIAVFAIDDKTGHLKAAGDFSTRGKTPRNFEIDPTGTKLFVGNEDSGNIVVFGIDLKSGSLTEIKRVLAPSPVSLRFVPE
jgi:6-phosphogluconolactonase